MLWRPDSTPIVPNAVAMVCTSGLLTLQAEQSQAEDGEKSQQLSPSDDPRPAHSEGANALRQHSAEGQAALPPEPATIPRNITHAARSDQHTSATAPAQPVHSRPATLSQQPENAQSEPEPAKGLPETANGHATSEAAQPSGSPDLSGDEDSANSDSTSNQSESEHDSSSDAGHIDAEDPFHQASDSEAASDNEADRVKSPVTCVTADFAMQNVLLQMGLQLQAPNGLRLKRVSRFVQRCSACFFVVKVSLHTECHGMAFPAFVCIPRISNHARE